MYFKNILALLTAVICLGMTACGAENNKKKDSGNTADNTAAAAAAPASENGN